ncbi:MAG: transposase [Victivallales bacterium]
MKAAPETGPNRSGTRYSAAYKLKAVKLYLEEGYQVKAIARELGIGKSSLGKWIREYREKVLALSRFRRRKVLRKQQAGSLAERKFSNTKPHIRIMESNRSLRSSAAFSVCR